jgi:hypothetical protein
MKIIGERLVQELSRKLNANLVTDAFNFKGWMRKEPENLIYTLEKL